MSHHDPELATGVVATQGCRFPLCACFGSLAFVVVVIFVFEEKKRNANFKAFIIISKLLCGQAILE